MCPHSATQLTCFLIHINLHSVFQHLGHVSLESAVNCVYATVLKSMSLSCTHHFHAYDLQLSFFLLIGTSQPQIEPGMRV